MRAQKRRSKSVHRVVAAKREGDGGEAGGEASEGAGEGPTAERRGDAAGEPDGDRHRERSHHAQREVRLPGEAGHEPGDPGDEGRVVDVPQARSPAASHVVELVPEDTVAGQEGQVEEQDGQGGRPLCEALTPGLVPSLLWHGRREPTSAAVPTRKLRPELPRGDGTKLILNPTTWRASPASGSSLGPKRTAISPRPRPRACPSRPRRCGPYFLPRLGFRYTAAARSRRQKANDSVRKSRSRSSRRGRASVPDAQAGGHHLRFAQAATLRPSSPARAHSSGTPWPRT